MALLNSDLLNKVLTHLNNILETHDSPPIDLVVCGGSSLIATGLITRGTRDVDVLAILRETEDGQRVVEPSKPLPDFLVESAKQAAGDLALPPKWLNSDTSSITMDGLPPGFTDRLHKTGYGKVLTVHFIGRLDQIHLKLYAASFPDERHLQDLIALNPNAEELEMAAKWTIKHWESGNKKRSICKEIIKEFGYDEVAERIQE